MYNIQLFVVKKWKKMYVKYIVANIFRIYKKNIH